MSYEASLRTLFKRRFTNTRFDWLIDWLILCYYPRLFLALQFSRSISSSFYRSYYLTYVNYSEVRYAILCSFARGRLYLRETSKISRREMIEVNGNLIALSRHDVSRDGPLSPGMNFPEWHATKLELTWFRDYDDVGAALISVALWSADEGALAKLQFSFLFNVIYIRNLFFYHLLVIFIFFILLSYAATAVHLLWCRVTQCILSVRPSVFSGL